VSEVLDRLKVAEDALADVRRLITTSTAAPPPPEPVLSPAQPGGASPRGLSDMAAFFASVRNGKALGPKLSPDEVSGCEAICAACVGLPLAWTAYALATAVVETAGTMQPIKEYGGNAYFTRRYDITGERPDKARELGNLAPGDGARFCGRGYVQMTGKTNYAKAGDKLGLPLVADPDLALQPDTAAKIMRQGMVDGWFTGKSFATYLPAEASVEQFKNARRIINGQDRALEIAGFAMEFQSALRAGGWA
jgi:putative chitinase